MARGELPPDVLSEELEPVPDAMDEVVADEEWDEDLVPAADEEEDDQPWLERIIELTRVTKVWYSAMRMIQWSGRSHVQWFWKASSQLPGHFLCL